MNDVELLQSALATSVGIIAALVIALWTVSLFIVNKLYNNLREYAKDSRTIATKAHDAIIEHIKDHK